MHSTLRHPDVTTEIDENSAQDFKRARLDHMETDTNMTEPYARERVLQDNEDMEIDRKTTCIHPNIFTLIITQALRSLILNLIGDIDAKDITPQEADLFTEEMTGKLINKGKKETEEDHQFRERKSWRSRVYHHGLNAVSFPGAQNRLVALLLGEEYKTERLKLKQMITGRQRYILRYPVDLCLDVYCLDISTLILVLQVYIGERLSRQQKEQNDLMMKVYKISTLRTELLHAGKVNMGEVFKLCSEIRAYHYKVILNKNRSRRVHEHYIMPAINLICNLDKHEANGTPIHSKRKVLAMKGLTEDFPHMHTQCVHPSHYIDDIDHHRIFPLERSAGLLIASVIKDDHKKFKHFLDLLEKEKTVRTVKLFILQGLCKYISSISDEILPQDEDNRVHCNVVRKREEGKEAAYVVLAETDRLYRQYLLLGREGCQDPASPVCTEAKQLLWALLKFLKRGVKCCGKRDSQRQSFLEMVYNDPNFTYDVKRPLDLSSLYYNISRRSIGRVVLAMKKDQDVPYSQGTVVCIGKGFFASAFHVFRQFIKVKDENMETSTITFGRDSDRKVINLRNENKEYIYDDDLEKADIIIIHVKGETSELIPLPLIHRDIMKSPTEETRHHPEGWPYCMHALGYPNDYERCVTLNERMKILQPEDKEKFKLIYESWYNRNSTSQKTLEKELDFSEDHVYFCAGVDKGASGAPCLVFDHFNQPVVHVIILKYFPPGMYSYCYTKGQEPSTEAKSLLFRVGLTAHRLYELLENYRKQQETPPFEILIHKDESSLALTYMLSSCT